MGFFKSLKEGLKKTRDSIFGQIDALFKRFKKVDEELFEELEELLIAADVGMLTSEKICDTLRDKVKETGTKDPQEVRDLFIETIANLAVVDAQELGHPGGHVDVILLTFGSLLVEELVDRIILGLKLK